VAGTPNYVRITLVTRTVNTGTPTITATLVGWQVLPVAILTGAGAPVGACNAGTMYQDTVTDDLYLCEAGAWVLISFGGGGAISGSGAANQVTYWTGASTVSGAAAFTWNGSLIGTPATQFNGATSGSATVGAAAISGTPARINLPTTTASSGQFLQSDGGTPQQTSWATVSGDSGYSGASAAGAVTWDLAAYNRFQITLTESTTLTLSNITAYKAITVLVCEDGTGGWSFTWPASINGEMEINTTASKCNSQAFVVNAAGTALYAVSSGVTGM
jgi:hypothetical protein